jgi:2-keto-3-deoxy-L-rhamnonate aldolase RhmA
MYSTHRNHIAIEEGTILPLQKNRLKERIVNRDLALGTHIDAFSPTLVEVAGLAGLDYVYIETEHAPLNWETLEHMVRAAEVGNITPLVRLDEAPLNHLVRKALEAGVQGVIIPHVSTVDEAEAVVQAVKFPPRGVRGMGTMRSRRYGTIPVAEYIDWSDRESLVILVIEEKAAVDHIEDILSVDGIDAVVFGPTDYSISIGVPGQTTHAKVLKARKKVVETALRLNVAPMITCNSREQIRECLAMGVRLLSLGGDTRLLLHTWRQMAEQARQILTER